MKHNNKKDPQKSTALERSQLKKLEVTNLTLNSEVNQDT